MIEPTETESKETLDAFADAMLQIAEEARDDPELLHERAAQRAGRPPGRGQGRPRPHCSATARRTAGR